MHNYKIRNQLLNTTTQLPLQEPVVLMYIGKQTGKGNDTVDCLLVNAWINKARKRKPVSYSK